MKKLLILGMLLLASCAKDSGGGSGGGGNGAPPPSLLIGTWHFTGSFVATLQFDASGSFTIVETYPANCTVAGTYVDLNSGQSSGRVNLFNTANNCSTNSTASDSYTIANHQLVIGN